MCWICSCILCEIFMSTNLTKTRHCLHWTCVWPELDVFVIALIFLFTWEIYYNFYLFSVEKEIGDIDKCHLQAMPGFGKSVYPCKSDDSGYSWGNTFDENPVVEALVCDLNQDFIQKKSLGRDSDNLKAVKSRINKNLFM